MKKPVKFSYAFSGEDVLAIVSALPLVPAFGADAELQQHINENLCASAMDKLSNKSVDLIPNEIRVVALSIELARDLLGGNIDLDVDPEFLAEIKKHFFTYNRLYASFGPLLDQMDAQLDS